MNPHAFSLPLQYLNLNLPTPHTRLVRRRIETTANPWRRGSSLIHNPHSPRRLPAGFRPLELRRNA